MSDVPVWSWRWPPDDTRFGALGVARHPRVRSVTGGAERADSVALALAALRAPDDDWVMVHDAVRPCVSRGGIDRLIQEADPVSGALLALPLADTLKRAGNDDIVTATVPREGLWRAQTPQLFRLGKLRSALQACAAAGRTPTDEAQAIEWQGERPRLVRGAASNLKVTERPDLVLASAILRTGEIDT